MTDKDRRDRFEALMRHHWIEPDDDGPWPDGGAEDANGVLFGIDELPRYVAITTHDDCTYLYAVADLESALVRLQEHVQDDIYSEDPYGVYDLDTGTFWAAEVDVRLTHAESLELVDRIAA